MIEEGDVERELGSIRNSLPFHLLSFPFPNIKTKSFRVPTRAERVLS